MKLVFIALVWLVLALLYLAYKAAFGREFDVPTFLKEAPPEALAKARPVLAIQYLFFSITISPFLFIFFLNTPATEIKSLGAMTTLVILTTGITCRAIIYLRIRKLRKAR
jgi:hypothetical protein